MQGKVIRILILFFIKWVIVENVYAQCITVTDITSYKEDFETSNGNWISGGTLSDWAWGTPSKPTIKGAASGLKCWITAGLTNSFYNDRERSYITSPCFDFSNVTNPFIQFKVFWETEYTYDGASFQYSLDDGASWQNVGAVNEPANCLNANWFNCFYISNLNGLGPDNQGWSGTIQAPNGACGGGNGSGAWLNASHTLSNLAGKPKVMFRFTFGAGYLCNNFDGFAIDDIIISNASVNSLDFVPGCITNLQVSFTNITNPCFNNYKWNFGDPASGINNATSLPNPTHTFSSPGNYTVTLTATSSAGMPVTATKQIHVIDVKANITQPVTCNGNNGTANAIVNADALVTGIAYSWNTTPVSNTALVKGLSEGIYVVTATADNACAAKDTVTLTSTPLLMHNINTKNVTCLTNGSISINETGGSPTYQYVWQPDVSGTSAANNLSAGTYNITVTDNAGCKDVITTTIAPYIPLKISLGNNTNICPGDVIKLYPGNFASYMWQDNTTTSSYNANHAGTYSVQVTDSNGCSASASVQVTDSCQDILFPTAFTPNGDDRNDDFGPLGTLSLLSGYSLTIFNRFGQAVFTSTNPYKKWNGATAGANGDGDVYVWLAAYSFHGGKRKVVKGFVVLVR